MAKLCFLFDASAVIHYYLPKKEFEDVLAYLMSLKKQGQALFFIPSFCIAEAKNTFAKFRYRIGTLKDETYNSILAAFLNDVINRKTFYSYDLNRYHNLNTDSIFEAEHSINTEFNVAERLGITEDLPQGDSLEEKEQRANAVATELKSRGYQLSKFYLSAFDILIIAMAIELQRFYGEKRVIIVTKDERLKTISEKGHFSEVIYLPRGNLSRIQSRLRDLMK